MSQTAQLKFSQDPLSRKQEYYRNKFKLANWIFRKPLPGGTAEPDNAKIREIDEQIEKSKTEATQTLGIVIKALGKKLKGETKNLLKEQTSFYE